MTVRVDTLNFDFPADWTVCKYDELDFFRRFQKLFDGTMGIDLLATSPERTLYLIEAKDFRRYGRKKSEALVEELLRKTVFTFAALLPASIDTTATDRSRDHARAALAAAAVIAVFHIEPNLAGGLPTPSYLANIKQRLLQKLHRLGIGVEVARLETQGLPWTVQ